MAETSPSPTTFKDLLSPGMTAMRRFWKPFLLLQACAFLLVMGYDTLAPVKSVCDRISVFKQHSGLIFMAIAAAVAGGLMPEFSKAIMLGDRAVTQLRIRNTTFAMSAYALNGIITDFQYRGIAWLIGNDTHLWTVIKKMLVDQFVTTPLYSTPYWLLIFLFRSNRYNPIRTLREISPRWYFERAVPFLIPNWCFWIPMTLLIYALPGPLQFCLYCFVAAAWSLVMVFIASQEAERETKVEVGGLKVDSESA